MSNIYMPVNILVKLLLCGGLKVLLTICLGKTSMLKFSSAPMWLIMYFEYKYKLVFYWF